MSSPMTSAQDWQNFNTAAPQKNYELIPAGTLAKVRMTIQPGGYNDANCGWTEGYATLNPRTGSVYLTCEFVIMEGEYAKRKVWSHIGLYSANGPEWSNMGRSFIRAILSSARGLSEDDHSQEASNKRYIRSLGDLNGIEFVARIDVETNKEKGTLRNVIKNAISKDHPQYETIWGVPQVLDSTRPSWGR